MNNNPFLVNSPVIYQKDISKDFLIRKYLEKYCLDIRPLLSSTEKISVYKCLKTGYCFYYPFEITGDSKFYEKLQSNEWYYMPWKWEHQVCQKYIKSHFKILEIGCGKGDFLKKVSLQFENTQCYGLELNKSSVYNDDRICINNLTLEEFSEANQEVFDIVCSFQVLEHIPAVKDFLSANIKCLKNNGLLVISVPNNNSFIKYDRNNVLNMPPHHMGLWTAESLLKIGEAFNLDLVEIVYEPLQPYHFNWYINVILKYFTGKYPAKVLIKAIDFFKIRKGIKHYLQARSNKIRGHSVLIAYRKAASHS